MGGYVILKYSSIINLSFQPLFDHNNNIRDQKYENTNNLSNK